MLPSPSPTRLLIESVILAVVLPGLAGAVNASGFQEVGMYTSHMTGHVARVGVDLVAGHLWNAAGEALLLGTFLLGSTVATLLIGRAQRRGRPRYAAALLFQTGLFVAFTVHVDPRAADAHPYALACILCMAMGLQNA